jgi:hypothetical protein
MTGVGSQRHSKKKVWNNPSIFVLIVIKFVIEYASITQQGGKKYPT